MIRPSARCPIYVDTNLFVYALEGPDERSRPLMDLFSIFKATPGMAVTSELTLAEVLPKKRIPDRQFLDLLIWSGIFGLYPVTRDILIETADYRRENKVQRNDGSFVMSKLPDAIHAVTAIRTNCGIFFSSDAKIKLPDTMKHIRADEAGVAALIRELA